MLDTSTPRVQVLPPLRNGLIVRVTVDGKIGELTWHSCDTAYVVHGDHVLGRGPWIMHRDQVVPATPEERLGYWRRYEAKLVAEGAPASAIVCVRKRAGAAMREAGR